MHIEVDSGTNPLLRWCMIYDNRPPRRKFMKASQVVGENLWPAIVRSGLGGNTYSRCILTSFATTEFMKSMGFNARIIPAVLDVSHRRDLQPIGSTLGIGEPDPTGQASGIHVVCEITEPDGQVWIIDGAVRQAARRMRWQDPPEVVVAATFVETPEMHPEEPLGKLDFYPIGATAIDQGDGTKLHLQWLTNPAHPDRWTGTPDADPLRSSEICRRLKAAWSRMK